MTSKVRDQILKVRDTGETNMFDIKTVQYVAYQHDWYDLVAYLMDRDSAVEYAHFIMTGEAEIEKDEDDVDPEELAQRQLELVHSIKLERMQNWMVGTIADYPVQVKVTEEGSEWGIDCGRIIKLFVTDKPTPENPDPDEIISYERGWAKYPKTPAHEDLLDAICEYFANRMDDEVQ